MAISAALNINVVYAQEEAPKQAVENSGLERIEVTARRAVEDLQEVPISVTSIGAAEIAENGITDVTDIQQYAANTTLQVSRGTSSTLTAYIRGIGQQDPLWGYEPGVGVYVDNVYIARPQGGVMEILDVERVEVLRGPQGTLYGKNTIGGALKYVTKKMSGDNTFDVSATVGDYGLNAYKASGQLSLIDDKLYIGGAFADINRDGFGEFKGGTDAAGEENYNKELFAGRVNIEYHPTDDLFFGFAYDKTVDDSNAKGGHRLVDSALTGQKPYDNVYDSDTSLPTLNKVETSGVSLTIDWNFNENLSVKSVTSSREGDTYTNIDFDNTAIKSVDISGVYDDEQFTQEIQMSYVNDDVAAVGGLYYYEGDACGAYFLQLEFLGQVAFGFPGYTAETGGCTNTESYSAYGQASFNLNKQWSMTVGGRYTEDTKDADVHAHTYIQTVYPNDTAAPANPGNGFSGEETWTHFSPRIGVEYQATEDVMYYMSFANGFKSGGFNMRADPSKDPQASTPFAPEIVDTLEIGFKSEPTDDLRINATYFYSDYTDMQVSVARAEPSSASGIIQRVLNAGEAKIQGVELETIYAATDDLTLNLSLGYIDAEFVEFMDENASGEVINNADAYSLANTPDLTINFGGNYTVAADFGAFVFTANASYRADIQIFETPSDLDQEAYTIVNIGASFYHSDGQWSASLHGNNILDKQVRIAGYNFPGTGGEDSVIGYYNDPSTIAFTVKYEY